MQRDADPSTRALETLARSLADPDFLAAVCHDLRGPLGAMGTWIHVLASGRADADTQRQALDAMQRDLEIQRRLIEQLGELSSILGGTLQVSVEEVDLVPLLRQRVGDTGVPAGTSARVCADPRLLAQLLAILFPVNNGGPLLGPAPILTTDPGGTGALSIRASSRNRPGLVSLTLARALAEVQDCDLTVLAAEDGTAFVIRLPASRVEGG